MFYVFFIMFLTNWTNFVGTIEKIVLKHDLIMHLFLDCRHASSDDGWRGCPRRCGSRGRRCPRGSCQNRRPTWNWRQQVCKCSLQNLSFTLQEVSLRQGGRFLLLFYDLINWHLLDLGGTTQWFELLPPDVVSGGQKMCEPEKRKNEPSGTHD